MKFCFYTNTVSPHQLPLAREIVKRIGPDGYRYVHTDELTDERRSLGWDVRDEPWVIPFGSGEARRWLREADVVMMQHPRDWTLFEERLHRGKICLYASERWFKPVSLFPFFLKRFCGFSVDGRARLFAPSYRRMAKRFLSLVRRYDRFLVLPVGIHAKRDFEWLGVPEDRMLDWGYFVEEGKREEGKGKREEGKRDGLKVLWVGRMLGWKRVDTVIRAVGETSVHSAASGRPCITLDIYGTGPEESRLRRLAARYGDAVRLHSPVPIDRVRRLMREHDVYVIASDANEGWGAAVNEALEEGMKVLGTFEAGASAAMLGQEDLFRSGDWISLAALLEKCAAAKANGNLEGQGIGEWTPAKAADRLLEVVQRLQKTDI